MKTLQVGHIHTKETEFQAIAPLLAQLPTHTLAHAPWEQKFPYRPQVHFCMAHNGGHLFLKYIVKENSIRAAAGAINENVWQDTCVEFFVTLDRKAYYNFEFNCIGTALVGFGREKSSRKRLARNLIEKIACQSVITRQDAAVHWELTAIIPVTVFEQQALQTFSKLRCYANFYKCGDALPEPHFLTWSNIQWPEPNFHLPEFFGELIFE